jgi:MraZ protein
MLTGTYRHTLDAKYRVFVPAKMREKLGASFVITVNTDKCLSVYSNEEWAKFTDRLAQLPRTQARDMIRFLSRNAAEVVPDAQGRVIIPDTLREFAGIDKNVVIIGVLDHAEIWDEARWDEHEKSLDMDAMTAQMIELGL